MAFRRGYWRRQSGLSMVELVIVLAVIGVVLSGVWLVADRVSEQLKINTAADQAFQIATNMRGLYAARQSILTGELSTETSVTGELSGTLKNNFAVSALAKGILPRDMCIRNCNASNPAIRNVWGGSVGLRAVEINTATHTPIIGAATGVARTNFAIVFRDVPPSACIVLATRTSRADSKLGLQMMSIYRPGGQHYALSNNRLPISVENAAASCTPTSGTTVDIQWVFSLH